MEAVEPVEWLWAVQELGQGREERVEEVSLYGEERREKKGVKLTF